MSHEHHHSHKFGEGVVTGIKNKTGKRLIAGVMRVGALIACPGDDVAMSSVVIFSGQVKSENREMQAVMPSKPKIVFDESAASTEE
jgi:hypothetical protein